MSFSNYANLQTAILNWLGRPGDELVSDHVPDMITLFEREATRRLRTRWQETTTQLYPDPGEFVVDLPSDFSALRSIRLSSHDPILNMRYVTPEQLVQTAGEYFTIEGLQLRMPDAAESGQEITIGYMQGLTPLSDSATSNWLLVNHPDLYLYGSMLAGEIFIGNDERAPLWRAQVEAGFKSIIDADRKARWGGGGLQIRPDIVFPLSGSLGTAGAGGTSPGTGGASGLTTVVDVTLNADETSTTVTNSAISSASYIELSPLTEDAAQQLVMGIWITPTSGSCTINHTSYESTTQTFRGIIHR
jgi:hypothetical protein